MPLPSLLKKASHFILGGQDQSEAPPFADGEVVFCKNNVCVHPPTLLRQDCDVVHHPGYLTVNCQYSSIPNKPTLRLSWIPNTTLRKNPGTIEKRQDLGSSTEVCRFSSIPSTRIFAPKDESHSNDGTDANISPGYYRQSSAESIESRCSSCSNTIQPSADTLSPSCNEGESGEETRSQDSFSLQTSVQPSLDTEASGDCTENANKNCTSEKLHKIPNPLSCSQTLGICFAQGNEKSPTEGKYDPEKSLHGSDSKCSRNIIDNRYNINLLLNCANQKQCIQPKGTVNQPEEGLSVVSDDRSADFFQAFKNKCNVLPKGERPQSVSYRLHNQTSACVSHSDVRVVVTPDECGSIPDAEFTSRVSDYGAASSSDRSHEERELSGHYTRSSSLTSASSLSFPGMSLDRSGDDVPTWMSSPELLALQHNLTFPESATASPIFRKTHRCRQFSVDLSQMRSLRLFFNDIACTCGQLVVASRESQYKILHFHHGGLDHLAVVLQEWNFLLHSPHPTADDSLPYRHFMVCRPEVSQEELHPEEGHVAAVSEPVWSSLLNDEGQLEDDLALRKGIFFGGLEKNMRRVVWPFLLQCFTFQSTADEREQIVAIRRQEYHEITRRRLEMKAEEKQNFWRNVQCIVEKDVVRTDRGNPYFAGENNPNIEVMKNILLNYAVYNPGFGYTQGMSDLLAPVLAEINHESDAFWCFVGLMQKAIFVCTPTDNDMDKNLSYLRELIRLMVPHFYSHLERHADAMELLFCHRWILLCFKREFPEVEALRMWEACWANYLTDYFHLFLCLAIMCIYSDDVIAQDLRTDEMLLHFSSLAMFMDGQLILRKARGLLHQFRQMPRIPCTLGSLCQLCGPGMWDSTHAPVIECIGGHSAQDPCPHRGTHHP